MPSSFSSFAFSSSFPSFLLSLSSTFFLPLNPPFSSSVFSIFLCVPRHPSRLGYPSLFLFLSYRVMTGDHEIPGISRGRSSEIRSGTIRTIFLPDNEGLSTWKKIRVVKEMTRNAVIAIFEQFLMYDCLIGLSRIFFFLSNLRRF